MWGRVKRIGGGSGEKRRARKWEGRMREKWRKEQGWWMERGNESELNRRPGREGEGGRGKDKEGKGE